MRVIPPVVIAVLAVLLGGCPQLVPEWQRQMGEEMLPREQRESKATEAAASAWPRYAQGDAPVIFDGWKLRGATDSTMYRYWFAGDTATARVFIPSYEKPSHAWYVSCETDKITDERFCTVRYFKPTARLKGGHRWSGVNGPLVLAYTGDGAWLPCITPAKEQWQPYAGALLRDDFGGASDRKEGQLFPGQPVLLRVGERDFHRTTNEHGCFAEKPSKVTREILAGQTARYRYYVWPYKNDPQEGVTQLTGSNLALGLAEFLFKHLGEYGPESTAPAPAAASGDAGPKHSQPAPIDRDRDNDGRWDHPRGIDRDVDGDGIWDCDKGGTDRDLDNDGKWDCP